VQGEEEYHEVEIEWANGSFSWEPLGNIAEDAQDACAQYALANFSDDELDETWDEYTYWGRQQLLIQREEVAEADVEDNVEEDDDDDGDNSSEDSDED